MMTASWTKAVLLAFAMYVPGVLAAAPPADSAILRSFDAPDGETYLAVSLRSDDLPNSVVPHDHVILVDTSASQIGEHRQHGHAVVAAVLDRLPESDRVAVYAVDLESVALTDGFVSPAEARDAAVNALHERFPAGATDLAAALNAAAKQLGTDRPGSILYIGDGMSTAHLIQPDEMRSLLSTLTDRQIPVHSYAVGPNKDLRLLGVLGHHTGGYVLDDAAGSDDTPEQVGRTLASALDRPVFYPESLDVNWESAEVLPNAPLPMRADRTTVYLARGRVAGEATIAVAGSIDGNPVSLSWNLPEPKFVHGNTFLAHLWWQAETDKGLSNGLAGDEMIAATHQLFEDSVAQLEAQGQQALERGQTEVAEQIGLQLRNIDPRNVRAASLIDGGRAEVRMVAQAQPAPAPGPVVEPPPPGAPQPGLEQREAPADASRIELVEQARIVKAEKLRLELEEAIQLAQQILPTDPAIAEAQLEGVRATIKSATDIDPDVQGELLRQVTAALQDVRSKTEVIIARQAEAQRRLSEIEAQKRLIDFVDLREEKLEQLVDRVRALMDEGFHGNPNAFEEAEAVA
ncbi:MAG: VWA domain-containing protein, partial [Maioricimonas sp. JB045]